MIGARQQRGSIAPFMVLALGGALLATAYAIDTSRMTNSAAQIKRATDAAAMAVGNDRMVNRDRTLRELQTLAEGYVLNNLGMDSDLSNRISHERILLSEEAGENQSTRYKVELIYQTESDLLRGESKEIRVYSTAEVRLASTEVALMLPNTLVENAAELAALRRLGNGFAKELLDNRDNAWLSLVPYSQAVSVYDADQPNRPRAWAAADAIRPVELRELFTSGKASSMIDGRLPDRRSKRLCMYRGLQPGQNYFWQQSPSAQFRFYYRIDLPENHPVEPAVSWVGPHPFLSSSGGGLEASDTRWMIGDVGCPKAPLLPLTSKLEKIDTRLQAMRTGFNINYAIAMGWAAMSLSPAFRGSNGWGDTELPMDFSETENGSQIKAIVMLANTVGNWFDSDSYNDFSRQLVDDETDADPRKATPRFVRLCNSFRERHLKFYFIGVRPGDPKDFGRNLFDNVATPALQICAGGGGKLTFANASTFTAGESQIEILLTNIAKDLRQKSGYVRLVE